MRALGSLMGKNFVSVIKVGRRKQEENAIKMGFLIFLPHLFSKRPHKVFGDNGGLCGFQGVLSGGPAFGNLRNRMWVVYE